jgi:hypothetical protein
MNMTQIPKELHSTLSQYSSLFESKTLMPPTREINHKIPLIQNYKPVNLRPYRYTYFQKMELEKIIAEMLKTAIIRSSTSPFVSLALLVKKKDGN